MRGRLVLPVALALLAGCGGADEPESDILAQIELQWTQLGDGSHFAQNRLVEQDAAGAYRCWPMDVGFDCLAATSLGGAGLSNLYLERFGDVELPERTLPMSKARDGYRCLDILGPREEIVRGGQTLISNRLPAPPWSSAFVSRFMEDNDVRGTGHFACLGTLETLQAGSLDTLSTTAVTRGSAGL